MTRFILPFFCLLVATGVWSSPAVMLNEKFTTSLMKVLAQKKANLVISPVNMESALGVIGYGAEGETADELFTALGYQSDQAKQAVSEIEVHLHKNPAPGVTRKSSDRIMVVPTFPLKNSYVSSVTQTFPKIEVANFDFKNPARTADEINSWVSQKTNNEIKKIVDADSVGTSTAMMNINALYFKGYWLNGFNKDQTSQGCFYPSQSPCVLTDLMTQTAAFKYYFYSKISAKIIELPYKDIGYSMVVVVPDKYKDFTVFMAGLDVDDIFHKIDSTTTKTVAVTLPRFKMEFNLEMKSTLAEMGVNVLFSSSANLTAMSDVAGVYVDKVYHKGKLNCIEEETVSSAGIGIKSINETANNFFVQNTNYGASKITGPELEEDTFSATRPFLYMIRGKEGILFSGVYLTPP